MFLFDLNREGFVLFSDSTAAFPINISGCSNDYNNYHGSSNGSSDSSNTSQTINTDPAAAFPDHRFMRIYMHVNV